MRHVVEAARKLPRTYLDLSQEQQQVLLDQLAASRAEEERGIGAKPAARIQDSRAVLQHIRREVCVHTSMLFTPVTHSYHSLSTFMIATRWSFSSSPQQAQQAKLQSLTHSSLPLRPPSSTLSRRLNHQSGYHLSKLSQSTASKVWLYQSV